MAPDTATSKGVIFDIKPYALHDGPGIRTTVFLKGCPLHCWWCHNPESRRLKPEKFARLCRMADRTFEKQETVGRWVTVAEVMNMLEREQLFHDQSGGGVTFSGGEPLMQINFLESLLLAARERELHICLDTSGFTTPQKFNRLLPLVDLFLYDLKLMDEENHIFYTGVSNRPILQNLETVFSAGKTVIIRFPVIPGITDTDKNLRQLRKWLTKYATKIQRLDLLPYHGIAEGKYRRFNLENRLSEAKEPSESHMEQLRTFFITTGVPLQTGG